MLFGRPNSRTRINIDIFINFGNDEIFHKKIQAKPGISALDALAEVAQIDYLPDDSATAHHGAMVTGINGFKVDLHHFWMYYAFMNDQPGWSLPMCTPDSFAITGDCRLGWRYHTKADEADTLRYGPLYSSSCINKIRRCGRQF